MKTMNVEITGPAGCGKTQLATQLVLSLARAGHTNVKIYDEGEASCNDTQALLQLPKDTLVVIRTSILKKGT